MNIQKVFLKQAHLYLNSSLLVLIPVTLYILWNIVGISNEKLMVFVIPFLVYSVILFQIYLLNHNRTIQSSRNIKNLDNDSIDFFSLDQFVLYFEKEDRELLFFHPTGYLLGKLKEKKMKSLNQIGKGQIPKEYVLIDSNENELAAYYRNRDTMDVYLNEEGYYGGFSNENGTFRLLSDEVIGLVKCKTTFLDDQIENGDGEVILRVRKGVMPFNCQEIFRNPNTPMLTINPSIENHKKLLYFSILVKRFF